MTSIVSWFSADTRASAVAVIVAIVFAGGLGAPSASAIAHIKPPEVSLRQIPPTPLRVAADDSKIIMQPKAVRVVPPDYPTKAMADKVEGEVHIEFTIRTDGTVGDPRVVSEEPRDYGFANAAMDVFTAWTFTPKDVNGRKVAAPAHYRFRFKLQ